MSEIDTIESNPNALDPAQIAFDLLHPVNRDDAEDDIRLRFVELIARGYGVYYAGLAVGWSEAKIKTMVADPEMSEIVHTIQEFHNDTVEYAILRNAQAGNSQAQKLWALAKMPERGWVEKKTHVIEGQARLDVVHSVKEALRHALHTEEDIAAAHERFVIDTTASDE